MNKTPLVNTSAPIGKLSHDTIKELHEWQDNPDAHRPIKTNITRLDRAIGGIVEGSYVVIGGKWKSGKTTVAQHIATVLGVSGRGKVMYFLLEEMKRQMAVRSMTRLTPKVTRTNIRDLSLTNDHFADLETAASMLDKVNMDVDDKLGNIAQIIQLAEQQNAQWVVVDYFQLLRDFSGKKEVERLQVISRMIIESRNRSGITYIIVYQLNQKGTAHGSQTLYMDADLIIEISAGKDENTEEEIPGSMWMKILNSRQCPGGAKFEIGFSGAHSRIMDLPIFDAKTATPVQLAVFDPQEYIQEEMSNE
jgi:replicative DNA helicase